MHAHDIVLQNCFDQNTSFEMEWYYKHYWHKMHFVYQIEEHLQWATAGKQWHIWFIMSNDLKSFYRNIKLEPCTWFQKLTTNLFLRSYTSVIKHSQ